MSTLNISITDDMRKWVDQQIASGRYANASDYIRDLIRTNQSTTDAIRLALIEGEQSGTSSLTLEDIIEMEFPSREDIQTLK
ncbi:type II toxin-antitoxin system ParD family antitoxin [Cellvibrio sp. KY-GH-1]|uniref:type II toxin-antitoxin system ParD family antitoxin n=1 Tax=Cellvibrio sp. KY-GH-1 TaxID=2303332 RepID=UPI0012489209|nr:type II toxin-antitoxin system ParD family antitoxin [Cellvibrio sp. KY-GH-1]QEY15876.1 type II toxin-antitoxin system ParD family antitoxin [Cellvibrio sp. KY-GH-1]